MPRRDGSTPDVPMKVAYLTSYYPAVSHTFIRREVVALRQRGVDVRTFSIHPAIGAGALAPIDQREEQNTRYILGRGTLSLLSELWRAVVPHFGAVLAVALQAVRTVPGARARLWQLFYTAEAAILHRRLRAWGATHVHAHFGNAPADLARLASQIGNRVGGRWTWSFTMHGSGEFYAVEANRLPAKIVAADFIVCVSDYCRSQLMLFSEPEYWDKMHVVHCSVDPDELLALDGQSDASVLTVLCVGRLVVGKGVTLLIEAVEALRARGVEARVVLAGDGPARPHLEREASRRGVDVTFIGFVDQDELRKLLAEADCFCLPSFAEGVPVVLMEAMAAGLPVVATRITGVPELVDDGVSGLLVTPARVDELAEALAAIACDPERRRRMGEAGRAKVVAEFSSSGAAERLERLFAAIGAWSGAAETDVVRSR